MAAVYFSCLCCMRMWYRCCYIHNTTCGCYNHAQRCRCCCIHGALDIDACTVLQALLLHTNSSSWVHSSSCNCCIDGRRLFDRTTTLLHNTIRWCYILSDKHGVDGATYTVLHTDRRAINFRTLFPKDIVLRNRRQPPICHPEQHLLNCACSIGM